MDSFFMRFYMALKAFLDWRSLSHGDLWAKSDEALIIRTT